MLPEFARQQLSNQAYKPHRSAEFELNAARTALIKQRQPPMRGNTAHQRARKRAPLASVASRHLAFWPKAPQPMVMTLLFLTPNGPLIVGVVNRKPVM